MTFYSALDLVALSKSKYGGKGMKLPPARNDAQLQQHKKDLVATAWILIAGLSSDTVGRHHAAPLAVALKDVRGQLVSGVLASSRDQPD